MSVSASAPRSTALAAAAEAIGGVCAPLNRALRGLGWPYMSRSAIHARRVAGTLPVVTRQLGGRWVVYAKDAACLFETGEMVEDEPAAPVRRGPGRPRKVSSAAVWAGDHADA